MTAISEYVVVLTTLSADGDAAALARTLVTERLAACVNVLPPMESIYRWDGDVQRESERQLVIKTLRARTTALWDRLCELHPYDTPEFIVLPIIDGSDAYLRWIGEAASDSQQL
ncbi:MAG: divalent-cation tolerance protein CutA [Vicinamibacterales bacterium]